MADPPYGRRQRDKTRAHPGQWQHDLNPDPLGGQNIGERDIDHEPGRRAASDDKEAIRLLPDFTQDELQEIPVLTQGARLQQGAMYVDLNDPSRHPFRATAEMVALSGNRLVPKADTPHPFWNRIIRAEPIERQK